MSIVYIPTLWSRQAVRQLHFPFRLAWRWLCCRGPQRTGLMRTGLAWRWLCCQLGEFHSMIAGYCTWAQRSKQCSKGNLEILANILKGWIQAGQT